MTIATRLYHYFILMRFNKPIGTLLLLWPTLWALWIASAGHPQLLILSVFVGGVIVMRAAGCVINDLADRQLDGHVWRTKNRPLVTGSVQPKEALILFFLLCLMALGLVLLLNILAIALSGIALVFAICYPFMKRYTYWPQFFLALAFSWGIPMAFAAETGHVPPIAWLLFATAMLWTIIYDTQYAMADREDDKKIGVKSTALLFGRHDLWIISSLQILLISLFLLIGYLQNFQISYYYAIAGVGLLIIYQQNLIRHRDPKRCLQAFLNNQWVGLVVFLGIVLNL